MNTNMMHWNISCTAKWCFWSGVPVKRLSDDHDNDEFDDDGDSNNEYDDGDCDHYADARAKEQRDSVH